MSIAFLDKVVNAELSMAYGHTWTNTRTFTEQYTVTVPPCYESRVIAEQPLWRAYGTFTIMAGNTTLNLTNVYVDTPNTDSNAFGQYTVVTTPIDAPTTPATPPTPTAAAALLVGVTARSDTDLRHGEIQRLLHLVPLLPQALRYSRYSVLTNQ